MDSFLIKLIVVTLFGVVVGGGVYLVLFVIESREERAVRAAALAEEADAGTAEPAAKSDAEPAAEAAAKPAAEA